MKDKIKKIMEIIENKFRFSSIKSLDHAIRSICPKQVYNEIIGSCLDFRDWLTKVATVLSQSEHEMAGVISRKLNLPYLPRLFPIDISLLPDGISIADCRRAGCIPIFGHGRLSGIACVDPQRARELFSRFDYVPLGFALWITVARALDESERVYISQTENAYVDTPESTHISDEQIALDLICKELIAHNGSECYIHETEDRELEYIILINDSREAKGKISCRIRSKLFTLLEEYSFRKHPILLAESDSKRILVYKTCLLGKLRYELKLVDYENIDSTKELAKNKANLLEDVSLDKKQDSKGANVIAFPAVMNSLRESSEIAEVAKIGEAYPEKSVIIVDDNSTFARVLERFLAKQGIITKHFVHSREALEYIKYNSESCSVIVCDVHMPEVNGFEFVKRLRTDLAISNIPLVMLTSDDDIETELQLINDGADVFVTKSSDPRLLCVHVRRLIERFNRRSAA